MTDRRSRSIPAFRIEESSFDDGTRIVGVYGELELATAPTLGQRIRRPLFWEGTERVVVDLSEVVFLDSSGASALLLSVSHAQALGRALAFVCPAGHVLRRLRSYGLEEKLRVFPTRELAREDIRGA